MNAALHEQIELTELSNGLRVVSETVRHVHSVSLGVWIGVGSRDESRAQRGISHFIEHMLFKGTARRTPRQIADEIESHGGMLNAYTGKETTCYEARVLSQDLCLALDVLSDMVTGSLLDPEELEREKQVVLEEIRMYEDMPEELVQEVFEKTLYPDHPVGNPIAGVESTVSRLRRRDLVHYMQAFYKPVRIVVAAAGNLEHRDLVQMADRFFGSIAGEAPNRQPARLEPSGKSRRVNRPEIEQVHFALGGPGCSKHDERRYALSLLNNVLGGNMSSRLFQEIREKRGLAYAIGSYTRSYDEGGFLCIYGGTSPATFRPVLDLARAECDRVCQDGITNDELEKAKTQVRGGLVLGLESMSARMGRFGDSLFSFGRVVPLQEVLESYEAVTHQDIGEVARLSLDPARSTLACVGPPTPRVRA